MGLCRVDLDKGHRQYAVKYALNDKEGVASLLKDVHRLRERRFHAGDYAASDILTDLQMAIVKANLTNRQSQAIYFVYELDLTQKEAGLRMKVGQDVVSGHISAAIEKISEVFSIWGYGEIVVEFEYEINREEESLDEQI